MWGINVTPHYSELNELLAGQPGGGGSWYDTADVLAQGRDYLEQVTNYTYSIKYDARKGKVGQWGPKKPKIAVDFYDCEIYAMVAAEMVVGDMGWDITAWEKWLESNEKQSAKRTPTKRPARQSDIGAR